MVFFFLIFNHFHHRKKIYRSFKTHKALFTQIQVLQYSELVEFNIGIYVCLRALFVLEYSMQNMRWAMHCLSG